MKSLSSHLPRRASFVALGAFFLMAAKPSPTPSTGLPLKPAKVKQVEVDNKNYLACTKDALSEHKGGKISPNQARARIKACRDMFPGLAVYQDCKRQAIGAAGKPEDLKAALEDCKKKLSALQFDKTNASPIAFLDGQQIFFAGIGLNTIVSIEQPTAAAFNCSRLKTLRKDPTQAYYLLFGNHPKYFGGFTSLSIPELGAKLPPKKGSSFTDFPGMGRLFGDITQDQALLFLPSAPCDYQGDLGTTYAGLSVHYLLDPKTPVMAPYFGIAYYQTKVKETVAGLQKKILEQLGNSFRAFPKNNRTLYLAEAALDVLDKEGDPKNLCAPPRSHRLMAIIQGTQANPQVPEYLVVANVRNLCEYGDRLSRQF